VFSISNLSIFFLKKKILKKNKQIKRQAISTIILQKSINLTKTPRIHKFSTKNFEFSLHGADTFFYENINSVDNKMQIGFGKFLTCLDSYLDLLDFAINIDGETRVNLYGSVTLEDGSVMRATNSFHNRPWFSDIAILMDSEESNDYLSDQGLCYGKVIQFMFIYTFKSNNKHLLSVGFIVSRNADKPSAKSRINSMVRFQI
jgi:hypothetical protein